MALSIECEPERNGILRPQIHGLQLTVTYIPFNNTFRARFLHTLNTFLHTLNTVLETP